MGALSVEGSSLTVNGLAFGGAYLEEGMGGLVGRAWGLEAQGNDPVFSAEGFSILGRTFLQDEDFGLRDRGLRVFDLHRGNTS